MHEAKSYVVGIDEVGRGALAGPVVVAAAMVKKGLRFEKLKDSKKLSAKKRESWYGLFKRHPGISFSVARVNPRGIERMNISRAANLAALRAFSRLSKNIRVSVAIFLDGGLFLGGRNSQAMDHPGATTVIKGDEKITAVKVASIIAKVHRDRFMKKISKKYPQYSFEVHKGYGTKAHRDIIRMEGFCEIHRRSFLAKIV